jgi:hypothetical protein
MIFTSFLNKVDPFENGGYVVDAALLNGQLLHCLIQV